MKKAINLLFVITTLSLFTFACGEESSTNPSEPDEQSTENTDKKNAEAKDKDTQADSSTGDSKETGSENSDSQDKKDETSEDQSDNGSDNSSNEGNTNEGTDSGSDNENTGEENNSSGETNNSGSNNNGQNSSNNGNNSNNGNTQASSGKILFVAKKSSSDKADIYIWDIDKKTISNLTNTAKEDEANAKFYGSSMQILFTRKGDLIERPVSSTTETVLGRSGEFALAPNLKTMVIVKSNAYQGTYGTLYDKEIFGADISNPKILTKYTQFENAELEDVPTGLSWNERSSEFTVSLITSDIGAGLLDGDVYIATFNRNNFSLSYRNFTQDSGNRYKSFSANWSPDGQYIVFYRYTSGTGKGWYIGDANSISGISQMTRISKSQFKTGYDGAAFSPRSNKIALSTNDKTQITLIDLSGNVLDTMPESFVEIDSLDWAK